MAAQGEACFEGELSVIRHRRHRDGALEGKDWIAGSYSIADIAIVPWLLALDPYGARDVVGWDGHKNVVAYADRFLSRAAVQRGRNIPSRG